ncbi:MAG: hypothetical protein HKN43_03905 [Rhodothermales bacterium]|nr:hypothetical protein [Rhodothermales bacterium]
MTELPDSSDTVLPISPDDVNLQEDQSLRQLLLDQRPEILEQLEFFEGYLWSVDWTSVPFDVFSEPDSNSKMLISKPRGQMEMLADGNSICSFSPDSADSCLQFFESSDSQDYPVAYSIAFDDMRTYPDKNAMWYKITFANISGWVHSPYMYSSDDVYFSTARRSLFSHPFVLWEPTGDSVRLYMVPPGLEKIDEPMDLQSQPLADQMLFHELELHIEPDIFWSGDTPYFTAYLASPQDWETFCRQLEPPVPSVRGLIPMLIGDDIFSIQEKDLGVGYCD